ncbi:uncharacterized protein [Atheta coriaria]|uniref:uncharacterized protein n=1 Tax=Dalotia coriaria TaxID=877792 RepID=UPI0031F41392
MSKYAIYLCTLVVFASGKQVPRGDPFRDGNREGRWFGYRYTSTEIVPQMVTSLIPSSCVQVEPSLPPCRNVRNLEEFPRFLGGYAKEEINHEVIPSIHTTPLGWGEYFGIYAPTVTVTAMQMRTTTVLDPRTVVTFSVKGCKPSRLPMDLSLCPSQTPPLLDIKPTSVVTATVVPTTTMSSFPKPTNLESAESDAAQEVHNNLEVPAGRIQTQPLPL